MVYTVTFNPAVDYVVKAPNFNMGEVNRSVSEEIFFGGKGINVSIMLKQLGVESKALGFIAGFTGEAVCAGLDEMGIKTDFIRLRTGFSRINVKIKASRETELNGQGPEIDENSQKLLFQKLEDINAGDFLVLAGSVPKSMPKDVYEKILAAQEGKNIKTVVDASGELLLKCLKYKPFLVKPNNYELGEIFSTEINNFEQAAKYAQKLRQMGAKNVLVSLGKNGAVLADCQGNIYTRQAFKGEAVSSVGAGDSMVAGFIAGYIEQGFEYALKLGSAAGAATAFSSGIGRKEDVYKIVNAE